MNAEHPPSQLVKSTVTAYYLVDGGGRNYFNNDTRKRTDYYFDYYYNYYVQRIYIYVCVCVVIVVEEYYIKGGLTSRCTRIHVTV